MCTIYAISMAKGGVGKSVTSVNLGAALAMSGHRVAIVDNDPQGSLTLALGHDPQTIKCTLSNLMLSVLDTGEVEGLEQTIIPISDNLHLIPSNQKLIAIQNRLTAEKSGTGLFDDEGNVSPEDVLKTIIKPLHEKYNFILIDCAPSLSMLTINALVAADSTLLPVEAHYLGFEALGQILDAIRRIKVKLNPNLKVAGILLTKYQSRTVLCRNVKELIESEYGEAFRVFPEPVPFSIKAAEQAMHGASIFETDPDNQVATAYASLAREVMGHA